MEERGNNTVPTQTASKKNKQNRVMWNTSHYDINKNTEDIMK